MKTTNLLVALGLILNSLFFNANAQTTVKSSDGYSVKLDVYPVSIVPATNSNCDWGYNYQVKMHYNIKIDGVNAPSSLYTLQGTVGCESSSIFFDLPNNGGAGNELSSNAWTSTTDCNSANVNSKRCNTVNVQIHGPGIPDQTISLSRSVTALGIKLLSFSASLEQNKVRVSWSTASEENNDYFTIQRSADGSNWSDIKKIKGAGNSNNVLSYETIDAAPIGGTSFYRLKQTDLDGTSSYSSIQTVKFSSSAVSIYPIPNTGNTINIAGIKNYSNYSLTVLNATGNVVFTTQLNKASVDLPQLSAGLYTIAVKDKVSGDTQNLRYIKM